MRPLLEHLAANPDESFVVKYFDYRYYPNPWHFHPEYELVLVTESTGKRFIGDSVTNFGPGDFAFIGSNLPHTYRNDDVYYQRSSKKRAKSIVIHFDESSLGMDFLQLPEARRLRDLFSRAARGINITGKTNRILSQKMHEIVNLTGLQRWLKLLDILSVLADAKGQHYISRNYVQGHNEKETDRMNKVFDFVLRNYTGNITIGEVARLVNMADNSFSRYFRERTRQTFSEFVASIRLNHAGRLLIESQSAVADICFECGYNNLSHFNRQFIRQYKMSPLTYRKTYRNTQAVG